MAETRVLDIPEDIGDYVIFAHAWRNWIRTMRGRNGEEFSCLNSTMTVPEWDEEDAGYTLRGINPGDGVVPWVPVHWTREVGSKPTSCQCNLIQIWNTGIHDQGCPEEK